MQFKNIKIIDNAYGGYGVGTLNTGKKVFIPFAVKGDILNISITEDKKKFAYGIIDEIVEASDLRTEKSYCPLIGICGGCLFGNIKYTEQIKIKEQIVKYNFRNFENFKIDKIFSENPLRYRIKANIKFKDQKLGFYKFNSQDFIEIKDCPVLSEKIIESAIDLSKSITENTEINFIENSDGKVISSIDNISYTNFQTNYGEIFISPDSFFQSNKYLLNSMQKEAVSLLPKGKNVLELYCGNGFFTVGISKSASSILAVDFDKNAIKLAKRANINNCKFITYDLTRPFVPHFDFDALFVDPSRQGLSKSVIKLILKKLPKDIVYVSCNPTTMQRDIGKLSNFYKITNFYMFDMFPNTYHIETVCKLELK